MLVGLKEVIVVPFVYTLGVVYDKLNGAGKFEIARTKELFAEIQPVVVLANEIIKL